MASFNQSPLGQAPLPFISNFIAVIGSDTDNASLVFNSFKYRVASQDPGDLLELTIQPIIYPSWRRDNRII